MRIPAASLVLLASAAPLVLGHGQVHSVVTSSGTYQAADAYAAVDPTSPLRKLNTYGPAADFTGPDITCGPGGNTPVANLAEVESGSLVTFNWLDWTSVHPGPVMTYIAECPNGCANFIGDTGNVWVKIDQDQLVNGGDVALPEGIPLPGSYDPYDPGILVQLWAISPTNSNYTAPGGPVLLPGGTGDWANEAYGVGGTPLPTQAPPPSTPSPTATPSSAPPAKPTSTPSSAPISSAPIPSATVASVAQYGQCGGVSYTGPTVCAAGTTCTELNDYYYQCL
ncbi:hypothetical protein EW026_g3369 [Hermanssonia centrifuga]|uniref:lytic cellulose monooxygenase (C4-dehydrogenating) n=1 Tax=Hermanssonia centrifuga TaxID=98765 RepID=A0A4S4KKW6_9APHY|nr:hypothetical protein EW026_g3369 [Hermanssonia centrifuga]